MRLASSDPISSPRARSPPRVPTPGCAPRRILPRPAPRTRRTPRRLAARATPGSAYSRRNSTPSTTAWALASVARSALPGPARWQWPRRATADPPQVRLSPGRPLPDGRATARLPWLGAPRAAAPGRAATRRSRWCRDDRGGEPRSQATRWRARRDGGSTAPLAELTFDPGLQALDERIPGDGGNQDRHRLVRCAGRQALQHDRHREGGLTRPWTAHDGECLGGAEHQSTRSGGEPAVGRLGVVGGA